MGACHHRGMPRNPAIGERTARSAAAKPDRVAHLTKEAWRGFVRALQARLAAHGVSFGHWTLSGTLWERDGLTQRELSDEPAVPEPTTGAAIRAMVSLGYLTRRRTALNL